MAAQNSDHSYCSVFQRKQEQLNATPCKFHFSLLQLLILSLISLYDLALPHTPHAAVKALIVSILKLGMQSIRT